MDDNFPKRGRSITDDCTEKNKDSCPRQRGLESIFCYDCVKNLRSYSRSCLDLCCTPGRNLGTECVKMLAANITYCK